MPSFLDVVYVVFGVGAALGSPPAVTTVLVCALPVAALLACNRAVWLRPAAPWLLHGRSSPFVLVLGSTTIVLAGLALLLWASVVASNPPAYLRDPQDLPLWLGAGEIVAFALVNPVWEEFMFRGVVLEELSAAWGVRVAVVVQAVLFGAAHWTGFRSGWFAMVMAGAWGLGLGIIGLRSRGILFPYAVHVGADAVIGVLALALLG